MTPQERATSNLLRWLKVERPDIYSKLPPSVVDPAQNGGLGDWTDIINTIANAAIQYDNNKTTRKQLEVNIARAQTGQDPVSFDALGNPKLPTQVSVSASANSTYLILGVAGVAIAAMFLFRGKGRR